MEISLFVLAVSLMFSGAHGDSSSMSCSTVNGQMICNSESGPGNVAGSSSSSFSGPGGYSQRTNAGTGFVNGPWQSSGQTVGGGSPSGFSNPSSSSSYSSSGATAGQSGYASAGNAPFPFPVPGIAYPLQGGTPGSGGPTDFVNSFMNGAFGGGGGGAFAGAGAFAGFPPFGRR